MATLKAREAKARRDKENRGSILRGLGIVGAILLAIIVIFQVLFGGGVTISISDSAEQVLNAQVQNYDLSVLEAVRVVSRELNFKGTVVIDVATDCTPFTGDSVAGFNPVEKVIQLAFHCLGPTSSWHDIPESNLDSAIADTIGHETLHYILNSSRVAAAVHDTPDGFLYASLYWRIERVSGLGLSVISRGASAPLYIGLEEAVAHSCSSVFLAGSGYFKGFESVVLVNPMYSSIFIEIFGEINLGNCRNAIAERDNTEFLMRACAVAYAHPEGPCTDLELLNWTAESTVPSMVSSNYPLLMQVIVEFNAGQRSSSGVPEHVLPWDLAK